MLRPGVTGGGVHLVRAYVRDFRPGGGPPWAPPCLEVCFSVWPMVTVSSLAADFYYGEQSGLCCWTTAKSLCEEQPAQVSTRACCTPGQGRHIGPEVLARARDTSLRMRFSLRPVAFSTHQRFCGICFLRTPVTKSRLWYKLNTVLKMMKLKMMKVAGSKLDRGDSCPSS